MVAQHVMSYNIESSTLIRIGYGITNNGKQTKVKLKGRGGLVTVVEEQTSVVVVLNPGHLTANTLILK